MIRRALHTVSLLLVFAAIITAQEKRMQIFNAGEAQMLPEIKGIVLVENGKIVIGPIPDKDQRDGEYKNLDLAQGDEILFVNGKKIKSIEDFKKYFGEIKTGSNVKFAVQRDKDRFIVEFKKAEEAKGGQKIMRFTTDGKDGGKGNVKTENGKVIIGGKKMDLDSLKKSGKVIIKQK
ncbi:MAG: PDZ domain-containing protein [Ignavibacteria bacterium]|nr:PDZ domain-containing protein [Ignavibacteria bacterium]